MKTLNVNLSLLIYKDTDITIAYSPALRLFGHGDSQQEAIINFNKHITKFIKIYGDNLGVKLEKLGWRRSDHHNIPPDFKIPNYLLANRDSKITNIGVPKKLSRVAMA